MHRLLHPLLCLALLMCWLPSRAQWSGSANLSGGLGGMEGSVANDEKPMFHGLVQGLFQLDYKSEKFSWNLTANGKWEPNTTDNARLGIKKEHLGITYKSATTKPLSAGAKSNFYWKPSPDRNYSAWVEYQYTNNRAQNYSLVYDTDSEDREKYSFYYEIPDMDGHKLGAGLTTYHNFNSGRNILMGSFSVQASHSDRTNTWIVFKYGDKGEGGTAVDIDDIQGYAWKYRITPNSTDIKLNGDIRLQNTAREGTVQLKYTPGFRFSTVHNYDRNSGATVVNVTEEKEEWRDSVRLRETFNYLSVLAEPYLACDYKWNNLEAHADYAVQIYARRLNDDTHRQPLKIKGVYPVGFASLKWTISPEQSLIFSNRLGVAHPDDIKVCWYDRTAGYLDQLYRGNEHLLSPKSGRFGLEYLFLRKRFLSKTGVAYTRTLDEIDQTWTNEEIEGRIYKVFLWINSSNSHAVGLNQSFGWRGKIIQANLGVTYNQTRRISKDGKNTKDSYDWRLNGDITAVLGKGWSIGATTRYQSKVATFFTLFQEYCELNAFVEKKFKRFTLYLEGRHLLDGEVDTSFESEELQEYWIEEVRHKRRIFVLGAKWNF